jgi:four helix bundle protein
MPERIKSHRQLRVFDAAMVSAMEIFQLTKRFPAEERFSMTDQIRRSSRSVCVNIAEAWRRRKYPLAFVAKLNDSEAEACETQVWTEFAQRCGYFAPDVAARLTGDYDQIIASLVKMADNPNDWTIPSRVKSQNDS